MGHQLKGEAWRLKIEFRSLFRSAQLSSNNGVTEFVIGSVECAGTIERNSLIE